MTKKLSHHAIKYKIIIISCICIKIPLFSQVKYSISELDNNVSLALVPNENRRSRRGSIIRNTKNTLSLTTQVIPEISHENASIEEDKVLLNNGHDPDCNINRHLRYEHDNNSTASQPKLPTNRVISVIEEASV